MSSNWACPSPTPAADGPVIQKAGDRALALGIGMVQILAMVREFRQTNTTTPVVLMGYANPVERYDQKYGRAGVSSAFVADAAAAGVDGVLIVDYPPEECEAFAADLRAHGMDLIFLLAPTSTDSAHAASGTGGQRLCVLRLAQGRDWFAARSTPMPWPPCCRVIRKHIATSLWVWALASATPPPPAPWAKWPMPWSLAARSSSCWTTSRMRGLPGWHATFCADIRQALDA